jgi:hypothetical protein
MALCVFVVFGLLIMGGAGEACGGNCPAGDCVDCPCGETQERYVVADLCAREEIWSQTC